MHLDRRSHLSPCKPQKHGREWGEVTGGEGCQSLGDSEGQGALGAPQMAPQAHTRPAPPRPRPFPGVPPLPDLFLPARLPH